MREADLMSTPQDNSLWEPQQRFGENLIGFIVGVVMMAIAACFTRIVLDR